VLDVSVPSHSVSKELAEKIRNKYFPKKRPSPSAAFESSSELNVRLKKRRR